MTTRSVVVASHDQILVALSVLISITAAYASRPLRARVSATRGRAWLAWLVGAATMDGICIWSVHYTGTLALRLPVPVRFDWRVLVLSGVAGIAGSAGALLVVGRRDEVRWPRALAAGVLLGGVGISGLDYTAMAGMRLAGMEHFYSSRALAALAVLLAIALCAVGTKLEFLSELGPRGRRGRLHAGALVRGSANPAMHYLAMAATTFAYAGGPAGGAAPPPPSSSSLHVDIASIGILGISVLPLLALAIGLLTSEAERIRTEDSRLPEMFEYGPRAAALTTEDGRVVRVNQEFTRCFGYAPEEVLGRRLRELIVPPGARGDGRGGDGDPGTLEGRVEAEDMLRRKDGSRLQASVASAPFSRPGAPRLVYSLFTDVTERRRAEASLRESEERFRTIADAAPVHMWTVGAEGQATFVNRAWLDFTGRALAEELGSGWMDVMHPEDRDKLRAMYAVAVARRQPFSFEFRARRHDGEYRHLVAWETPWIAADGTFRGFIGSGMDITERKQSEEALRRFNEELERRVAERTAQLAATNRELEEATRHKSEFLSSMSHELRTPLNGIIGFAELIHDGRAGPVTPEQAEYLNDVLNSADHLLRLVNDVLDLARVESGKLRLAPESVSVAALVESVRDALGPMAEKRDVTLSARSDPSLGRVVVDPQRLTQVLYNYLANALHHTPAGGRVEFRATPEENGRFRIEVEDTGPGIRAEDLPRLFRDFEQIQGGGAGVPAGTGLGLALTRRLVEAMGGETGVRSEVGRGSVFWAVLPRSAAAGQAR